MTIEQIIGLIIALLIMSIGFLGSFLPGLPSTPVVLVTAVAHRLYFLETGAGNVMIGILVLITVFSLVLDYVAGMIGAKKLGATWRGVVGAVVGGIVGIFFSLPGILLGPFLGALIFEMLGGREFKEASRAGVGAVIGVLAGTLGKAACCIAMMLLFAIDVIRRSTGDEVIEPVVYLITMLAGQPFAVS